MKTQAGAPITPQQAYLRIQALCTFGCNVFEQTLTRARDARAPVWSYLVTYAGPWPRNHPTAWHTQDLALQFRVVLDPESEPLSRTLGHAWASFCRTGSPSTEELLWPPYTTEGRLTMLFDHPCRLESDPLALPRRVLMDR